MRIKLAIILTAALLLSGVSVSANGRLDVEVTLEKDGSAHIREIWDMTFNRGTEWYLVRDNLGDISITNFSVSDENGLEFFREEDWDIDRSLGQKAGRCGIIKRKNGCELCWGLGSHGNHVFDVRYTMTNVVKSANDYDYLHIQFVSQGIDPAPDIVKVTVRHPGTALDTSWARVWAFGYDGEVNFDEGTIVATADNFDSGSSVILLARFDKGTFASSSLFGGSFSDIQETAFRGSAYADNEEQGTPYVLIILAAIFAPLLLFVTNTLIKRKNIRDALGGKTVKEVEWSREVPYGGDLLSSYYVMLHSLHILEKDNSTIASAMILHMVQNGCILATKGNGRKPLLSFPENADLSGLGKSERELYEMMLESSGSDRILQSREFSKWARRHPEKLMEWNSGVRSEGRENLRDKGSLSGTAYTSKGIEENRKIVGLKKYLSDTTLIKERSTPEVHLWRDYIIFAALAGIADKVAKELSEIDPAAFEQATYLPYQDMNTVIYLSRSINSSVLHYGVPGAASTSAKGGFGGGVSFGGGGGFSGGGFGGGAR